MEPDAGVHHHALQLVLAHQDAALGVVGIVAGMDADALEVRHALQIRQPLPEPRRLGDEHPISALGDGGVARNLSRHLATLPAILALLLLGLQLHPLQVAPRRLQGVAEVSVLRQLLQVKLMKKTSLVARLYILPESALRFTSASGKI